MRERTKLLLAAVLVAGLAALLWRQHQLIDSVREQNQTLSSQLATTDSARTASHESAAHADDSSTQVAADRAELERLRAQSESMRNQLQQAQTARVAIARSATTPGVSRTPLPPGFISMMDAQDVGAASGEAMMQTFIWAMRTADTNRIAALLDASAEGAQKVVEDMLRSLPAAAERAEFDQVAATMGFHFIREMALPDGDTALIVEALGPGGNKPDRKAVRIRRSGNDWRMVLGKSGPEEVKLTPEQMGN